MLYGDTGRYKNRQFGRSDAIILRTTYDEIFILWNQELKVRPGFSTTRDSVNMPVLFAEVLGVENGRTEAYWLKVKSLLDKDTFLIRQFPHLTPGTGGDFQTLAVKAIRDGRLQRSVIREHRQYPFGLLRDELQEHILDKLQAMLDRRLIKGTFANGTEYTVISVVLGMQKELVRLLQSFDFTKRNPKVICISTREQTPSL